MNSLTRQVDSGRAPLVIVPPPLTYWLLSRLHLSRRDIARLCSCVCVSACICTHCGLFLSWFLFWIVCYFYCYCLFYFPPPSMSQKACEKCRVGRQVWQGWCVKSANTNSPHCWWQGLVWIGNGRAWKAVSLGLWRSNSSYCNDAFALIFFCPLHWKKKSWTFCH